MHEFLRGSVIQMGPFGVEETAGDGYEPSRSLLSPVAEAYWFSAGAGGTEEEFEAPELEDVPVTADATINAQMQAWRQRQQTRIQTFTRRANGENRRVKTERNEAQSALEAARRDGLVITADDKKALDAFRALNLTPEQITEAVTQRDTLQGEVATSRKDASLRSVAEAAKYDFDVLKQLGGDREYEVRDVNDAQGQPVKTPFIKDGEVFKPLSEFVDANWAKFKPSLAAGGSGTTPGGTNQVIVPGFPPQPSGGGTTPGDPIAAFLETANKAADSRPNPFKPQPAPATAG